jgi:hypothetical protein
MIRWEPVKGESQGFAVFDHGTKREMRIVLNSSDDFDYIQRAIDNAHQQGRLVGALAVANSASKFAYELAGVKRSPAK